MAKHPNPDGLMAHRLDLEDWNEVPFRWERVATLNFGHTWLVIDRFWTGGGAEGPWSEAVALAVYGEDDEPQALHCMPNSFQTHNPHEKSPLGFNYWGKSS